MYKYFTELVDFVGSRPKPFDNTKKYISTGALKTNNISEDDIEMIDFATRPSRADLEVKNGDILFAKMAFTDKRLLVGEIEADYIYSTGFFAVKPKEGIITSKCLYFLLNSESFRNQKDINSTGATQKAITIEGLKKISLRIPEYHRQNQIGKTLENIDEIIKLKKQQLKEYDQLIKSRFVEMFGDIFNGKSNYSTIKISEAVVPKIERAKKDFNADDEIKYLDISSVDNRKNIIIGYTDYLMKDAPSRAQQHVRKDDIVISTVRPNLNNVAKVTHDYSNIVASSGFCVLRASKVEPNFLFALVSMQSFADYLASLTTGANYPAVSDKDILNFEIPNAPFEEQTKFSDFIKQVDKLKFVVQQSLDETQKLFDSLMQKYFG